MDRRKYFYVDNRVELLGVNFYCRCFLPDYRMDKGAKNIWIDVGILDFRKTKEGELGKYFLRLEIARCLNYLKSTTHPDWGERKVYNMKYTLNLFGKVFTNDRW